MRWKAVSLREKCPNPEFFQVRIRENTKQKKFRIWTFSHIVHFNDGKERRNQTEWYGLRSTICPGTVNELEPFEKDLIASVKIVKLRKNWEKFFLEKASARYKND